MKTDEYFYNCPPECMNNIDKSIYEDIKTSITSLPKCENQKAINHHYFRELTSKEWAYDSVPIKL
jgi:hypothetical protein